MKSAIWLTWLLAAGTTLGGCSGTDDHNERNARENLALWLEKGPPSYVYVIRTACFCKDLEPVRVVVENGVVQSSLGVDSGKEIPEITMTEMLQNVVKRASHDNAAFEARYDRALGYLTFLDVDVDAQIADDEFTTTVSCLGAGSGDDVCAKP